MLNKTIAKFCVLSASILALAAGAQADDKETVDSKKAVAPPEKIPSWITGDVGVTFISRYYSRGILQEWSGFIVEPNLDLFFKLIDNGDKSFFNSLVLNLSLWDSFHSNKTGVPPGSHSTVSSWYESDYYVGLTATFAKNFSFQTSYFEFDYPSGVADPQRSLNFQLNYNDSDLLGAFALHPHLTYLYNFQGIAGLKHTHANYFEVGLAPGYTFAPKSTYPVTLTAPLTAGFGDSRFYGGDSFGYFSAGLSLGVPLAFISPHYGTWTLTFAGTYYKLGSTTSEVNHGHTDAGVASANITCAF